MNKSSKATYSAALPDNLRLKITELLSTYCAIRCPARLKDKVRLGFRFRGNSVTLFEERPLFLDPERWVDSVVAQFRFNPKTRLWTLYAADRNSRWFEYWDFKPSKDIRVLISEVEVDPTGIFWG